MASDSLSHIIRALHDPNLSNEGGLSTRTAATGDPGGRTMLGVTQRTYNDWRQAQGLPAQDVLRISNPELEAITRTGYWDQISGDRLPVGLDYSVLDTAFNGGIGRAATVLKQTLGIPLQSAKSAKEPFTDDLVEAATAAMQKDPQGTIARYTANRRSLWETFSNADTNPGWWPRITNVGAASQRAATQGPMALFGKIPIPGERPSDETLEGYANIRGGNAPQPPGRPSDQMFAEYAGGIDGGGALDRFSDGLTGGLQSAARAIANQYEAVTGRLPSLDELAERIGRLPSDAADVAGGLYGQLREIAGSAEAQAAGARFGFDPNQYAPSSVDGIARLISPENASGFYSNPGSGVNAFLASLNGEGGLSNGTFADPSVAGSGAFQAGNLVNAAYHQWLGRDPSAEERATWTDRIGTSGSQLGDILAQIAGSPEASGSRNRAFGTDASTGGAGTYDPSLGHTSYGSDASTSGSVPGYTPNTGTAVGTDASRGGAYSYDPFLGYTSRGSDASTGGAASYGGFLDPLGFSGAQVGTAGGVGNPVPDTTGPIGNPIAAADIPTPVAGLSPLPGVDVSNLGMGGARDSSNPGAYGASGSTTTATPDSLGSFGAITPTTPFSGSAPDVPYLSPLITDHAHLP